jgi:two-component system sensor histidine kinase DesK
MREKGPGSSWAWQAGSGSIYALFVFAVPAMTEASWQSWLVTLCSFAVYLLLYIDFFRQWGCSIRRQRLDLGLIGLLGFAVMPFNMGATTYVAYAAGLAPFVLRPLQSILFFAGLAALVWTETWLLSYQERTVVSTWITCVIFIVGCGNLFLSDRIRQTVLLRRANEDVKEMAKVAERERIARDLHDLLGHTLSVIALKSELASKLADRDRERSIQEIREVERISREALSEVRAAVEGYKNRGFSGELRAAEQVLASAGVRLEATVADVSLLPMQEAALALALRETITNVVRHARASVCRVALSLDHGEVVLTVEDDGAGGPLREGNGLGGMRERVTAAGGTLKVDWASGVKVSVRFRVASAA